MMVEFNEKPISELDSDSPWFQVLSTLWAAKNPVPIDKEIMN